MLVLLLAVLGFSKFHTIRHHKLRASNNGHSFIRALAFKHRLRICNAYPYGAALDVFRGKEKLTDNPMKYKECHEFHAQLKSGDKLEFRVNEANAGTFSVLELPPIDAILLLVISRHDTLSTAVSFKSHIFANLLNAQIAVIDTFKGDAHSSLRIEDVDNEKAHRSEELRYDSVVAINPGSYNVVLHDSKGQEKAKQTFEASNHESYMLIRVGVEAHQGPPYPEDLIVYPLRGLGESGAAATSVFTCLMLLWLL